MSAHCKHCGAVAGYGHEIGHKSDCPSLRIVGHKTFDTGRRDKYGLPVFRHEPLTQAEGEALWESAKTAERKRAEQMPDEQSAIRALWDAHQRLKELGWKEPMYCPKDGTKFKVIELGSTGIFEGAYRGEWPNGSWDMWDDHDMYCSSIAPAMFKLHPEDEEKRKAKMAEAARRFREEGDNQQETKT